MNTFQIIVRGNHGGKLCDVPVADLNEVKTVVICGIFNQLRSSEPQTPVTVLYRRTAGMVGMSERSIQDIIYKQAKAGMA